MIAEIISAFYFGLLCSIAPCPLTTNIATLVFIGRKSGHSNTVISTGICYVLGRILTFVLLGIMLAKVLNYTPQISHILQKYMNMALGPLLIIIGMFLLEMIKIPFGSKLFSNRNFGKMAEKSCFIGAFLLGCIFALSFCPASAALFFGALLPLAIQSKIPWVLPGVFGIASGIPVVIFAIILAYSTEVASKIFNKITQVELWMHRLTGMLFLILGIYFTFTQTLKN